MTMPKENTGAVDDFTVDEGDIADTDKVEDTDINGDLLTSDDEDLISSADSIITPTAEPAEGAVDDLGGVRKPVPATPRKPRKKRLGDDLVRHPKGRRKRTDSVAGQKSVLKTQTPNEFFDTMI